MKKTNQQLKGNERTQNKTHALKVRTDIRSGQCPPGCVYNSEYNMCFCKMNPS